MSKTIVITGASSGLGKEISKHFIEKGWNVVMNAKNPDRLDAVYQEFGKSNNVLIHAGDIGDKQTSLDLIRKTIEKFGAVDVLVNNAGIFAPKPFLDVTEEDLDKYFKTNLKGTYFATQSVINSMIENGGGAIINIGTVLVDHAIDGFPASAPVVSKGAIHTLTRQLAAEFSKKNIRVNTISPGVIRSPLQAKIGVDDADSLAGLHLLNRIGEAADIAEAVHYLATSQFVTGETLDVAGGHVVGHTLN